MSHTSKPLLCINCRFSSFNPVYGERYCDHPDKVHVNLIDGSATCESQRFFDDECGREGERFEKKLPWWKLWETR
jgi:hypothetical protein